MGVVPFHCAAKVAQAGYMTEQLANPLPHCAWARLSSCALLASWLLVIAAGWWCLDDYAYSINAPLDVDPVEHWPLQSSIARQRGDSTLLLFLHPKCPCSQATLTELDRLLTSLEKSSVRVPRLVVVSTVPDSADESWLDSATTRRAELLPNAELFVDRGGRESDRFGATSSGLVMLFDETGGRQFAGGVTEARGHEGSNIGSDRLASILRGDASHFHEIPAFGCRLCLPEREASPERIEQAGHDGATPRTSSPRSPDNRRLPS
jgi:hypothetical protein